MSDMGNETDFKVVDRRASSGNNENDLSEKKSENPVAKDPNPDSAAKPSGLNQVDLSTLLLSVATGAMIHLGLTPDPATKKIVKNLEIAKQNIELLQMLKQKTQGNLNPEEIQLLDALLTEVHLRFVEASKTP